MEDELEKVDKDKKFKTGKYCGFRVNNQCNSYCGLFNVGLGGCVFHSISMNIRSNSRLLEEIKNKLKGGFLW